MTDVQVGNYERLLPPRQEAHEPPEARGLRRDEVRLLVSEGNHHHDARFTDLTSFLRKGDLVVVNRSATLPAALPAVGPEGDFVLHLSTRYGRRLWLCEPRPSASVSGPMPLPTGQPIQVAGTPATVLGEYPGIPRLRFVAFEEDPNVLMTEHGRPIRYGYLTGSTTLADYQTIFADTAGSAEMPSAARPFSDRIVSALRGAGVELRKLTLHTGVSSLEAKDLQAGELYPEPFEIPLATADALNTANREGRRIIAVGSTVVRALCSAWQGSRYRATAGMTRAYVRPGRTLPPLSGLLTGFHEPEATHLAMLQAVAGYELIEEGYRRAQSGQYLWHEFGDVHLLLPTTPTRFL